MNTTIDEQSETADAPSLLQSDCLHRNKRLVEDIPTGRYEIQCATCLLTGDPGRSGLQAYGHWLALMRAEYMNGIS